MKNTCTQWRDQLLQAALGETPGSELRDHLVQCADCAQELEILRSRNERLENLMPQLGRMAEPSPDLGARILEAAEASTAHRHLFVLNWRAVAGAIAVVAIAAMGAWFVASRAEIAETELRGAQALAQWKAPTDFLLRSPAQDFLSTTPRLGESYINMQIKTERGGK
jgi:anti-sigma factor RsiW